MELREYEVMYETEKDHWWFRGKRKIVFSQVDKLLGGKLIGKKYSILDLGCGTGIMIKEFEKYGEKLNHYVKSGEVDQYLKKAGIKGFDQSPQTPYGDPSKWTPYGNDTF